MNESDDYTQMVLHHREQQVIKQLTLLENALAVIERGLTLMPPDLVDHWQNVSAVRQSIKALLSEVID